MSGTCLMPDCAPGDFVIYQSAHESFYVGQIPTSIVANIDDKSFALIEDGENIIKVKIADVV